MKTMTFEQLCAKTRAAQDSDFFEGAPQWAQRILNSFSASDFVIRDANHRYNIARAIQAVEQANKRLSRDFREPRRNQTGPILHRGKTARDKARRGNYNCPCVTKEGKDTSCSSKPDHDRMIRGRMQQSKGQKS